MMKYIFRASFNPGGRFIILFNNLNQTGTKESREMFAYELFQWMYKKLNVARVILLYATDSYTNELYVTNPYRNIENCGKFQMFFAILMRKLTRNMNKHNFTSSI